MSVPFPWNPSRVACSFVGLKDPLLLPFALKSEYLKTIFYFNFMLYLTFLHGCTSSAVSRPPMGLETATSRSPASHRPLLGSSGSDLALSPQPSIAAAFSHSRSPSTSPSQHDTLVSIAQDGTLSLVGTLVSEHASVDMDFCNDQDPAQ